MMKQSDKKVYYELKVINSSYDIIGLKPGESKIIDYYPFYPGSIITELYNKGLLMVREVSEARANRKKKEDTTQVDNVNNAQVSNVSFSDSVVDIGETIHNLPPKEDDLDEVESILLD